MEEKELQNRVDTVKMYLRDLISECCDESAGEIMCDSYGCSTLQKILDRLEGAK
jgi:hypothetical protein